jgi:hypothetical protein
MSLYTQSDLSDGNEPMTLQYTEVRCRCGNVVRAVVLDDICSYKSAYEQSMKVLGDFRNFVKERAGEDLYREFVLATAYRLLDRAQAELLIRESEKRL